MNLEAMYQQKLPQLTAACKDALGQEKIMVLEKTRTKARKFRGTIVSAKPHGYRVKGNSVVYKFQITLEHANGKQREFVCEKLPR